MSAKIIRDGGRSFFEINGVKTPPVIYALSDFPGASANTHYAYKNIKQFGERGINIVAADSGLHLGWHKRHPFDPDPIVSELESVLDSNPNAKIILRLHVNPPYWWYRDNPKECIIYRTPDGDRPGNDDGEQDRLIRLDSQMELRASFASEKFLREASERICLFLDALKNSPAKDALIGIQAAYGKCGEWHAFGVDVSEPMQRKFREYLREKYETRDRLIEAYGDKTLDFDTVPYTPEPYYPCDEGFFRDPKKSICVIDSHMSNQRAASDAIIHFCKTIKEHSPEILCGVFYGYYVCIGDNAVIGGHLDMERIYGSPFVDYLAGPFCYASNRYPDGVPMQRSLLESARLHGKLWLTEMDQFPLGIEVMSGGTPENFSKNIALIRRNVMQIMLAGQGYWYYDHRLVPHSSYKNLGSFSTMASSCYRKRGYWDEPKMMDEIESLYHFGENLIEKPHSSEADVLLVFDTRSKYYSYPQGVEGFQLKLFEAVARAGAAYEGVYLDDIALIKDKRYKCVIVADCYKLSPEDKKMLDGICSGDIVYLYGSGYTNGESLSLENMEKTAGMKFKKASSPSSAKVCGEDISLEFARGLSFAVCDDNAEPIALFDNGEVAAARAGHSIYVGLPYLTRSLAKSIFEAAGVHIWSDSEDPVTVGCGMVAINCQGAGDHTLILKGGKQIAIKTEDHETRVYLTDSGERII